MGFLDDIKSKLPFGQNHDGYGSDSYGDYYDGDDAGDGYDNGYQGDYAQGTSANPYTGGSDDGQGLLGQTRRGEAESVAVYTRSGKPVGESDRHASLYNPPVRDNSSTPRAGAYDTPSSYAERSGAAAPAPYTPAPAARPASLVGTPQLPAYILRPESYDDVETVVRRVRTRQPVALVFVGVRTEVAKRVLDFSYGFCCGLGASVREVGDRVFMVLPEGCEVKDSDLAALRNQGFIKK